MVAAGFELIKQSIVKKPGVCLSECAGVEKYRLPENPDPYIDKYFLRTHEILSKENLNPFVRAQVFFRGDGLTLHGVEEGLQIIEKYSDLVKNGGRVYALPEGSSIQNGESVYVIEGRAQDLDRCETLLLGVLAQATTAAKTGESRVLLDQVRERARAIKELIGDRDLIYMGARHWHWSQDAEIAKAAFEGGATDCSTDVGAETVGRKGIGTIPHALEAIFAFYYGRANAVTHSTEAFDRFIDPAVPRVALIDFNNREIDDAVATAVLLRGRLGAVRIDTCGENVAQGSIPGTNSPLAKEFLALGIPELQKKYWFGKGVTVTGVLAVREALDQAGFSNVKIILSSGFAKPEKVEAFVNAEKLLGKKLFHAIGAGGLFSPCYHATMDLVAVAESRDELDHYPISKTGRGYRPNPNLQLVLGK